MNGSGFPFSQEPELIGESAAMVAIKAAALELIGRDCTVLILGEKGSGKESVARHIHQNSPRRLRPFIPVDCSALPDLYFERELLGCIKGAFNGASRDSLGCIRAADGGTLFLDEISELTLPIQHKLLQVLQQKAVTPLGSQQARPVNVRIISAAQFPLNDLVSRGDFLEYLLLRLNEAVLEVPPLRERLDDIIPLSEHFLKTQASLYGQNCKRLGRNAIRKLQRHRWPGNARELWDVMEQANIVASGAELTIADLPPRM